jgi:hypothetical protein
MRAVPDARCARSSRRDWVITLDGVGIGVHVWTSTPRADRPPFPDPLVAAGKVDRWQQPEGAQPGPMANVICETDSADRLVWSVLRFNTLALVDPRTYRLGPVDRPHGFNSTDFAEERFYMLAGGMRIWTRNTFHLTAELIVTLFEEALRGS